METGKLPNETTLSDIIQPNSAFREGLLRTAILGKTGEQYVDLSLKKQCGCPFKNPRFYRKNEPY